MKEHPPAPVAPTHRDFPLYHGLRDLGFRTSKEAQDKGFLLVSPPRGSQPGIYIRAEDLPRWQASQTSTPPAPPQAEPSSLPSPLGSTKPLPPAPSPTPPPPASPQAEPSALPSPSNATLLPSERPKAEDGDEEDAASYVLTPARQEKARWLFEHLGAELRTAEEEEAIHRWSRAWPLESLTISKVRKSLNNLRQTIENEKQAERAEKKRLAKIAKASRQATGQDTGVLSSPTHAPTTDAPTSPSSAPPFAAKPPSLDATPKRLETTLKGLETTLKGLETTPKGLETTPKGLETTPKGLETTPKGLETTPKGLETTPKGLETTSKGLETTSKGLETTSKGLETTSKGLEKADAKKKPENRRHLRNLVRDELLAEVDYIATAERILGQELQNEIGRDMIIGLARLAAEEVASMVVDHNFKGDRQKRFTWHFERKVEQYRKEYTVANLQGRRKKEAETFVHEVFRQEWDAWAEQIRAFCKEQKLEPESPLKTAWMRIKELLDEYDGLEALNLFKQRLTRRQEEIEETLKEHFRRHYQRETLHKLYHWRSDFAQYFPAARSLKRKIFFFCGPTNSGKTFAAMNALAANETGVYLAPLRLMALEGQQELGTRGKVSSFLTGEERDLIEGAKFIASTIEMLDYETIVDAVVIDEIQMINDPFRGWAWTNAFVGAPAETVILTGSADAIPIVKKIAEYLQEPLEIKEFQRFNQLEPLTIPSELDPKSLTPGTAIICFSRRDVLSLKQMLEYELKLSVSVIYGSLSPEVRREEARRFRQKETQILIATDAISMGLNLPVKTVLFWQTSKRVKFQTQEISDSDIKQIAGRAGRYGHEPKGYVGAFTSEDLDRIQQALRLPLEPIEGPCAVMPLLFHIEMIAQVLRTTDMEAILMYFQNEIWFSFDLFRPMVTEEMLLLAKTLREPLKDAPLRLKYTFICAPVDSNISHILDEHVSFAKQYSQGREVHLPDIPYQEYKKGYAKTPEDLRVVEDYVKIVTLYRWLSFRFPEQFAEIQHADYCRRILNDYISRSLSQGHLVRRCPSCGRILQFGYRHKLCDRCFRR